MSEDALRRLQVLTWIGIVDQLATTQANRLLEPLGLPMPQFAVLGHFARHPETVRTVTGVARAFQQSQPTMTKTIGKLLAAGHLAAEPDPADARSKRLTITPSGLAAYARARDALAPAIARIFAGWEVAEIDRLLALLDRLRRFLDDNRDLVPERRGRDASA